MHQRLRRGRGGVPARPPQRQADQRQQNHRLSDNNGNLSINGERFTQNYTAGIDVEKLLDFAGGVRQMLPVLGLDAAAQGDLGEAANEVHAEASSPKPDHGRLRQLVERLRAGLTEAAPTVAKTMLLHAAGEAADKAITGGRSKRRQGSLPDQQQLDRAVRWLARRGLDFLGTAN